MIFVMSDMHGYYDLFKERIDLFEPEFQKKSNKLILLGDYIDRGPDSFRCIELAFSLQKKYGKDQVIVIRGNHEEWFIDFLKGRSDDWLGADEQFNTSKTFIDSEQYAKLLTISSRTERNQYIRSIIKSNHKELMDWLARLPYYYETPTQIFVHAGVEEEIPEEEMDYCTIGTADYIFTGKYPPSVGKFYKTIIAGHTAASSVAEETDWEGIYFDKQSHYYIDGAVERTGKLLCLVYDEISGKYYEILKDGKRKKL